MLSTVQDQKSVGRPLIHDFLNKRVVVKTSTFTVEGRLIAYQPSNKAKRIPDLLFLRTSEGIHVVRGPWTIISEVKRKLC